jgi:hypothetical protein
MMVAQWAFLGIWSFVGHTFLANSVASSIGWATGSPFQIELAFYHPGVALATFSSLWNRNKHAIGAIVTAKTTILFGAMGVHLYHLVTYQNLDATSNIGFGIIIADFILPVILILQFLQLRKK